MVHTWCVTLMGLRTDGLKLNSLLSESASAYRQAGRTGLTFRFGDARHGARGERRQPAGPMLTAWLSSLLSSASVTHTTVYSPARPTRRGKDRLPTAGVASGSPPGFAGIAAAPILCTPSL